MIVHVDTIVYYVMILSYCHLPWIIYQGAWFHGAIIDFLPGNDWDQTKFILRKLQFIRPRPRGRCSAFSMCRKGMRSQTPWNVDFDEI